MGLKHLIAVTIALSVPVTLAARDVDADQKPGIEAASTALLSGKPQEALDAIEPVIAAYDADHASEKRRIYCGMSGPQTIAYMARALVDGKDAVALAPAYCNALYVKGFALVDLGRMPEARAVYERLLVLAPMHSHYLAELGQSYRPERNWPKVLEYCGQAESVADLAIPDQVNAEKGLAWRCMGYALIEQGKFDDAEVLYRKCLALDPNDAKAKNEMQYIAEQRRKTNS